MKLWNKNNTPLGGWKYEWTDSTGRKFVTKSESGGMHGLFRMVRREMAVNGVAIPEFLDELIEDQICTRQPAGACYYENKPGDQLAKTIHVFARAIDRTASAIGVHSNLENKARGCTKCGQRRVTMNQIAPH
jgi:hypothetical protein